MNELALFAGAGGGILGGHLLGWKTLCAVEIEDYPRRVLLQRQRDGILPRFPIWDDITTFDGKPWKKRIDLITGGFPCQQFSTANRGQKTATDRWPDMERIIEEIKPKFVFCENVSEGAIIKAGLDLWAKGYGFNYCQLSAKDVGGDHVRERFWLFAYPDNKGKLFREKHAKVAELSKICTSVWETKPNESGVAHGVANRVDRLKAIGNGQVPAVAALAFTILSEGLI